MSQIHNNKKKCFWFTSIYLYTARLFSPFMSLSSIKTEFTNTPSSIHVNNNLYLCVCQAFVLTETTTKATCVQMNKSDKPSKPIERFAPSQLLQVKIFLIDGLKQNNS